MINFIKRLLSKTNKSQLSELNRTYEEISHRNYIRYIQEINKFSPYNVDPNIAEDTPLTSPQQSFLQYIAGKPMDNPNVAQYWKYEYNIDFYNIMSRFFNEGYLTISTEAESLPLLKVTELKDILRNNSLPVNGKKADLVSRISKNIDSDTLNCILQGHAKFYKLTQKGIRETEHITDSATKNLQLEDECMYCILNNDFNGAYRKICEFELSKQFKMEQCESLKQNLENSLKMGLENSKITVYENFLNTDIENIPHELNRHKYFKASIILGQMLGVATDKIKKLFLRLSAYNADCNLDENIIYLNSILMIQLSIEHIKNTGCDKLEIITHSNDNKCRSHNGNVVMTKYARPCINVPPFHKNCTCAIAPHYDNQGF